MTVENYEGLVMNQVANIMGRWSYQYLSYKDNRKLVVISAYQVSKQSIQTIDKVRSLIATAQQVSVLALENWHEKPRKAIYSDLDKFIQKIHNNGDEILLIGDYKDGFYDKNSGLKQVFQQNNLVDLMWKECGTNDFATQIDYTLVDLRAE